MLHLSTFQDRDREAKGDPSIREVKKDLPRLFFYAKQKKSWVNHVLMYSKVSKICNLQQQNRCCRAKKSYPPKYKNKMNEVKTHDIALKEEDLIQQNHGVFRCLFVILFRSTCAIFKSIVSMRNLSSMK